MDVEGLLQSVIRFSNFMTSRLVVAGVVFYVASGFTDIGSASEGFLPDMELINSVVENYQTIFDVLGVSDFALLLILFVFLTTIHIIYVLFERVGRYIPPAIVPLSGWVAIDDLTLSAFDVLRAARGEEHTDEENQRLYEFKKKLRDIERETDESYGGQLAGEEAAFAIAKTFILFSLGVWVYALLSGTYTGDTNILLIILAISVLTALYTAFAIFRANHSRIASLRESVINQFMGFAHIWASEQHQKQIADACTPSRDLRPATFAVVVPVYGTLDLLVADWRRWRGRRRRGRA
ncbi:hypothetical protein ABUE31_02525 [Mesorhizobium sp. ZMM04-5]|uniref:Uncharacterized protein n=1 Tax=Mesorhizobium marinum TaxID=3228790 RepID=A0ABV3QUV5_9HYPH